MELFATALLILVPVVLHYQFLLGQSLLEPIATPSAMFDRLFNQRPLIFSFGAGLAGVAAVLLRDHSAAFYLLLSFAIAMLIADWVGCSVSLVRHLRKRRRR